MKFEKAMIMRMIFSVLIGVIFLSCFGVSGAHGQIEIVIPDIDGARSLEGYTNTGGGDIKGTVIYGNAGQGYTSKVFHTGSTLTQSKNSFVLTNIPTGTYIFGILIQNSENYIIGLAIKEAVISAGSNEVPIKIGPGIQSAQIGNIIFGTNPIQFVVDNKNKYSVSFGKDRINFIDNTLESTNNPDNADVEVSFTPMFSKDNTHGIRSAEAFLIDASGNVSVKSLGSVFSSGVVTAKVTKGNAGVRFKLYESTDSNGTPYVYDVYLKDVSSN